MKTIVKIYQNNLVSDILRASCFSDLKNSIDAIISKLKSQDLPENQVQILFNETLKELKQLNESRLSYDQHANIISAKNILKQIRSQEIEPDNRDRTSYVQAKDI
jgi:hypothetical protein